MTAAPTPPSNSAICPSCGLAQEGSRKDCSRCGHPLYSPSRIYRRKPDGTWSPVDEIDLSQLVAKPAPVRKKLNLRKAAIVALLVLAGMAFDIAFWRKRVRAVRREAEEIARYIDNPIGRIVPRFEIRYLRMPAGELQIAGQTNLPEGTVLDVQVYAGPLLVAVDYPVTVRSRAFQTRPLLERGKPFAVASYQVRIRAAFDKRWQPPSVLVVVGSFGERLVGPDVQHSDGSSGAKLEFSESFLLKP